jgi:hypothetical protein
MTVFQEIWLEMNYKPLLVAYTGFLDKNVLEKAQ